MDIDELYRLEAIFVGSMAPRCMDDSVVMDAMLTKFVVMANESGAMEKSLPLQNYLKMHTSKLYRTLTEMVRERSRRGKRAKRPRAKKSGGGEEDEEEVQSSTCTEEDESETGSQNDKTEESNKRFKTRTKMQKNLEKMREKLLADWDQLAKLSKDFSQTRAPQRVSIAIRGLFFEYFRKAHWLRVFCNNSKKQKKRSFYPHIQKEYHELVNLKSEILLQLSETEIKNGKAEADRATTVVDNEEEVKKVWDSYFKYFRDHLVRQECREIFGELKQKCDRRFPTGLKPDQVKIVLLSILADVMGKDLEKAKKGEGIWTPKQLEQGGASVNNANVELNVEEEALKQKEAGQVSPPSASPHVPKGGGGKHGGGGGGA